MKNVQFVILLLVFFCFVADAIQLNVNDLVQLVRPDSSTQLPVNHAHAAIVRVAQEGIGYVYDLFLICAVVYNGKQYLPGKTIRNVLSHYVKYFIVVPVAVAAGVVLAAPLALVAPVVLGTLHAVKAAVPESFKKYTKKFKAARIGMTFKSIGNYNPCGEWCNHKNCMTCLWAALISGSILVNTHISHPHFLDYLAGAMPLDFFAQFHQNVIPS